MFSGLFGIQTSIHLLCFPDESVCLIELWFVVFIISGLQWVTVTLALLGKGGIASSYIIIYIWTAELFPTSIRNVGIGASSLFLSIGGMIAPYTAHLVSMSNHSNCSIISKDRGSATILKHFYNCCSSLISISYYLICSLSVGNGLNLSSTSHIDTLMTYCPLITQTLRLTSVRCIPLSMRSDKAESNISASFLDLLLSIDREGQIRFRIFARLWRCYLTTHLIRQSLLFLWMFYSEGGATFQ